MFRKTLIQSESHRQESHATPSLICSRFDCGVVDDDCLTGRGEMCGNRRTDALGRSRNKCDLIVECAHVVLLSCEVFCGVKLRLEILISRGADSSALWRCTRSRQRTIRIIQGRQRVLNKKHRILEQRTIPSPRQAISLLLLAKLSARRLAQVRTMN